MKTILIGAAVAALLVFAPAAAQEARTPPTQVPAMRVIDVLMLGEGTVTGTVTRVGAKYVALSDGQQTVDVTSREFLFDGLREGDRLTVTGTVNRGTLKPTAILMSDGAPLPKRAEK